MKARLEKRVSARRFSMIFILVLAAAAFSVSVSAAQQQSEQTQPAQPAAVQPPQPPDSQVSVSAAQPGQDTEGAPRPEGSAAVQPVPASPGEVSSAQTEKSAQAQSGPLPSPEQAPAIPAAAPPSGPAEAQVPDIAFPKPETAAANYPSEISPLREKAKSNLMDANFTFYPIKALDPFVPFVSLDATSHQGEDEGESRSVPLTPLQKMTLSEIEKGLKAITWGELGKKAVIEDATGRGYIVAIGTPAGEHSGVITQISNDHLVIQQEIWDMKAKKRLPQDYTIKIVKKDNEKK